jgi:pleiotropic regulator 1
MIASDDPRIMDCITRSQAMFSDTVMHGEIPEEDMDWTNPDAGLPTTGYLGNSSINLDDSGVNMMSANGDATTSNSFDNNDNSYALTLINNSNSNGFPGDGNGNVPVDSNAMIIAPGSQSAKRRIHIEKPNWHAPWELSAVISGHIGWVRSIAFDPSNEWFATGSADRTIKIWDLAKCCAGTAGGLKLTLTGHIDSIRALEVSPRHPYLFSAGEDKMVKCWDLETNKVIRHYHGHLSGVFSLALHPTIDVLITGGRDSVGRVWDMRTKTEVHVLAGHKDAIGTIMTNSVDPQVITGSHDASIKLWDLAAGKVMTTLTHHKKSVRSLAMHPRELTFISGSPDNIKKWQCRDGRFLKNFSGHKAIVNSVSVNEDGVAVSCGDDGSMRFWDYETGYCFQQSQTTPQPGSIDAENGIYVSTFDKSSTILVTGETDKSIKIWRENTEVSEREFPIDMDGWTKQTIANNTYY